MMTDDSLLSQYKIWELKIPKISAFFKTCVLESYENNVFLENIEYKSVLV